MNYLGCVLDETMLGETMALRVIEKINSRLKFLYRKNRFLDVPLCRCLCNALIQPHFDYACTAWYPQLTKKLKDKLQVTQNKCIRFCLILQCLASVPKFILTHFRPTITFNPPGKKEDSWFCFVLRWYRKGTLS